MRAVANAHRSSDLIAVTRCLSRGQRVAPPACCDISVHLVAADAGPVDHPVRNDQTGQEGPSPALLISAAASAATRSQRISSGTHLPADRRAAGEHPRDCGSPAMPGSTRQPRPSTVVRSADTGTPPGSCCRCALVPASRTHRSGPRPDQPAQDGAGPSTTRIARTRARPEPIAQPNTLCARASHVVRPCARQAGGCT